MTGPVATAAVGRGRRRASGLGGRLSRGLQGLLRRPRACPAPPRPARSRRPTASSPGSTTRTATRAMPRPSAASRRSTRPTRSSPTPRSGSSTTSSAPTGRSTPARAAARAATRSAPGGPFAGFRPAGGGGAGTAGRRPLRVRRRPGRLLRVLPHVLRRRHGRCGGGRRRRGRGAGARRDRRRGGASLDEILAGMGGIDYGGAASHPPAAPPAAVARPVPARPPIEVTLEEAFGGGDAPRRDRRPAPRGDDPGRRRERQPDPPARPGRRARARTPATSSSSSAVRPHPVFTRDGANLTRELPVTLARGAPRRRGPGRRRSAGSDSSSRSPPAPSRAA